MQETKDSTFTKFDSGKLPLSLLPFDSLEAIAEVLAFGAKKYGANNWRKCTAEDIQRYEDATLRHLFAYLQGEGLDKESGLTHLAHVGCNILFLLHFSSSNDKITE